MAGYAVCVGINNYKNYPQSQLRGCVDDAERMADFFADKRGLSHNNIIMLKDAESYKSNIMSHVEEAFQAADRDKGFVLFSQSSHGTQTSDPNGGICQALCCHNLTEANGDWDLNSVIINHEFRALLMKYSNVQAEFWFDACHSGNGLRELGLSYSRARYMSHPGFPILTPTTRRLFTQQPNGILWAACKPNQTSADSYMDGHFCGAFTHAFLGSLKDGQSRHDQINAIKQIVRQDVPSQEPILQCGVDSALQCTY